MSTHLDFSKFCVDAASALTAVCAYHPLRMIATDSLTQKKVNFRPGSLYRGFGPGVVGSAQFLFISYSYPSSKSGDIKDALFAGAMSAPVASLSDSWVHRKRQNMGLCTALEQRGRRCIYPCDVASVAFRGFVPTLFRQMGVGLGMFVFPGWLENKVSSHLTLEPSQTNKAAFAFVGGAFASVLTHYPYAVADAMQTDQKLSMHDAAKVAWKRVMTRGGAKACAWRVSVVAVSVTIMCWGRENYTELFNKKEKS